MIVPVLNEAPHVERALASIRRQELEGALEVLVVDGGSTDGTRRIVERIRAEDDRVRLLDNPARATPDALNVGLRAARGTYVVRMDAHTSYPRDYIACGIERLERGDVASVSGPQLAVADGPTGRAVALALGSPLGVGGARFRRRGAREEDVDSGFCGVWRRDLLVALGGWDEGWPVNQDAELAARIRARGGRIVCLPEMAAEYVPRSRLPALARQYRRYGRYRAKTAGRHPSALRRSHVLPPGLVATVACAAVPVPRTRPLRGAVALYGAALLAEGWRAAGIARPRLALRVTAALATMHLSWGAGFLEGCGRFGVPWRGLLRFARPPRRDGARRPAACGTPEMRIGYVVSRFPAISETFVVRELAEVDGRPDVRCEIFSLFPERPEPVHESAAAWLPRRRRASPAAAARAAAYWAARRPVRLAGLLSAVVRDYGSRPALLGRALVTVACALQHARTLEAEPVDHLHAHFATYPALAAWTCSRLTGVPYSFTAHAHDIFVHRLGLRRRIEDAAFCVGISEHNAGILRATAPRAGAKIHVVHAGVHPRAYRFRPRAPRSGRPMRIACVAALKPYKGHRVLLDAVARLVRDGVPTDVDLAGAGPLRDDLARQCARLGIAGCVHFLGAMTEPEVADVLERADLFALASVVQPDGDTDGVPVALMEAMAAGVPVVASDLPGVRELVRHGETGLLAPAGDAAAFAHALRAVRDDPRAARTRARAARAVVEERFSVEVEASRLLALIRRGRLAREAAFHDDAFKHGTRRGTWRFYDAARDAYDRYDELIEGAVARGANVLEYGCGTGARACDLARRGAQVRGIDISPVAIDMARETVRREGLAGSAAFSVMDAEALDLPARSFGLVCGTSILHHLDVDRGYREIARVLAPTGRAIFLEPLGHNAVFNAYRRLTPSARTRDEHPLRMTDVEAARAHFGELAVEHFGLVSPLAAALRGSRAFDLLASALRWTDQRLFTRVPPLRSWSWMVVIVLSRPVARAESDRAPAGSGPRASAAR